MLTAFLTAVIGWYLVIFSLILLLKEDYIRSVIGEILSQKSLIFILGVITLILGLLMVIGHNLWINGWPLVITLFSWLVLIGGIVRIALPETAVKMGRKLLSHPQYLRVSALCYLIIGLIFLFKVYY